MLENNSLLDEVIPLQFHLSQNYPNPFNEKTTIKFCVAYKTRVRLTVYNSEGEEIEKLIDQEKEPGTYEVEFNAFVCHSGESRNLKEGTYFYLLEAGNYLSEKEMLLLK